MSTPTLVTKLYVPPPRPAVVPRPRLIERLDAGLHRKLTLVSAPAGSGKTTLVSGWVAACDRRVAWLSLDDGDSDLARFLTYLVAALQTIGPHIGAGVVGVLHSPQPPPTEVILTALLNEIATLPDEFVLVLDDYHLIDATAVDLALTFLLEHLPQTMHLVIATREDPPLPLARLRARGHLAELRAADLRFAPAEAAEFLTRAMGLDLTADDIAALETRTEGWIAGLQLAAISMQGHKDVTGFVKSFTGTHQFVLDYLLEEVLHQQPASVQTFLLRTSILDRLCGPLCDAVLRDPAAAGQATLEYLERANLFLVPLDDERRWYRYHHLFADLLRQRLHQGAASSAGGGAGEVPELYRRASAWYEDHSLEVEAFQHAAAAGDVKRAERLIDGKGIPLHFRGAGAPVLKWLASLPKAALDTRPSLRVAYASALFFVAHQHTAVEPQLHAAETALQGTEPDDGSRDLVGRIASLRATLAVMQHDAATIIAQSRRALAYLHPDNLPIRTATTWTLGYAYQLQGDRAAAGQAYADTIATGTAFGESIYTMAATLNLGQVQEADNRLSLATRTYRRVLHMAGDPPRPMACEAYLGLARICYQWNDLDAAQQHGQHCLQLTRQMDGVDTVASCGVVLARLRLARGDVPGAVAALAEAEEFVQLHGFVFRMPDVAAAQVLTLLHQGNLAEATRLAQAHDLPLSRARVSLARGDPSAALAALGPVRRRAEAKGWADERLTVLVLQAVAFQAHGDTGEAARLLGEALALAEPGGFIRLFVDEGLPMVQLLSAVAAQGTMPGYSGKLLAACEAEARRREGGAALPLAPPARSLAEPLSRRELEVLRLIAQGLSNREIGGRLFLALDTVKGHNRQIFGKLHVQRRTEAIARARELGLL
ncbi:MAG TPA: LuxR C-terminal-related transcriptional regulator [Thermomicrobiales bacterium]|nr:LuxR C-terminal-related transcriptional regulator [Thermomicrobiales bacterium]